MLSIVDVMDAALTAPETADRDELIHRIEHLEEELAQMRLLVDTLERRVLGMEEPPFAAHGPSRWEPA